MSLQHEDLEELLAQLDSARGSLANVMRRLRDEGNGYWHTKAARRIESALEHLKKARTYAAR